jgi:ligand-binding sensor domain-containing protein
MWFAAADGLFRLTENANTRTGSEWTRFTTRDGLASDQVRCILVAGGRLWAGTDRGLSAFDSSGQRVGGILLQGRRVSRLAVRRDSLFIASDEGLWVLPLGGIGEGPLRFTESAPFRRRVQDLILTDSVSVAIVEGQIYWLDGPALPLRDGALERIGPAFRLAAEDQHLWVAGPRGIAHRDPVNGAWEAFTVPSDIPWGPVVDVLPEGDDVWAATPAAAVRLRWR